MIQRASYFCGEAFSELLADVKVLSNALILVTDYYSAFDFSNNALIDVGGGIAGVLGDIASLGTVQCSPQQLENNFDIFDTMSNAALKAAVHTSACTCMMCFGMQCSEWSCARTCLC